MISTETHESTRKTSAWEKKLLGVKADKVPSLLPGLVASILLALFSIWLSTFIGVTLVGFDKTPVSPVMLAILLGLIVGALARMLSVLKPGLDFSVMKVLRLGIILLGFDSPSLTHSSWGPMGCPWSRPGRATCWSSPWPVSG